MEVNANTRIYDKAVDRAAMIRLYERRVNGKIELVIDDHVKSIDKIIRSGDLSVEGRKQLLKAIEDRHTVTFREAYNTSKRSLLDLVVDQISYAYQNLEVAAGKVWETQRPQKRVAEDIVLQRPIYGDRTLAAGWAGVSDGEKKRLEAIIRKGIADNKTVNEIALEVRKGNIHTITRGQSKGLVITAITSVTAQADHEVYKANKTALRGWQYVAVLDSRTTPVCAARDGMIFDIDDVSHLPPAHFHCRSTTIPVMKSWEDMANLAGVAHVRRQNLQGLSKKEIAYYDGQTPLRETYSDWLRRQPKDVQLRHLGDYQKVDAFISGGLELNQFTNDAGNSIGIKELRALTDATYTLPNDSVRFARAKAKLDAMQLGASRVDDFIDDPVLQKTLQEYYLLQTGELNGTLSATNYRGVLLHNKLATRKRVLTSPPREDQLKFNPATGRYEDVRLYQPNPEVLARSYRLVDESDKLLDRDKEFIKATVDGLSDRMSVNERAVVADNLRVVFGRNRENKDTWVNFKAVAQAQLKFDVMNISESLETQARKGADVLKKLLESNYIDPVLGSTQLQELSDKFIDNIVAKNLWEDREAPRLARRLRTSFDPVIFRANPIVWKRLDESALRQFYLKFAHRLSLADSPDKDALAVSLGRDLYNLANMNGDKKKWRDVGIAILESEKSKGLFEVETFGVQKRRLKSRMSGNYFGPYYDTLAYNIRITDPSIQHYARLTRKVDIGLRVAVTNEDNRLIVREGYKTYFMKRKMGLEDTRIPITSTNSFGDFPEEFVDKSLVDALNWASSTKYKIDEDYYDFIKKLLYFKDDKGKAQHFDELNEYRKFIASRGDAYERFKAMEWLRDSGRSFSNNAFVDHRARIYDRGLISPQSGETFRPFLNTAEAKNFSPEEFLDFQDQVGAFLGGLSDKLEGRYNSLTITGRQKIAAMHRPEIIRIGNLMRRGKPNDIREILESDLLQSIEGEEQGKFFRFAIETAKIDEFLGGDYSTKNLAKLNEYKIALALEQDASSSGAQIIALTTRNKQLAELSNVIPTNQKKRLYDEIAAATYNDPRFKVINERFGLTEKDLRKAAKAQNMVTFYGAGERTGIMNVEGKLSKVLGKNSDTLVVKAADRDVVLNEIDARIAKYERFDPETAMELRELRANVRDVFNKGIDPGDEIMEQLYFLSPQTRELVEKMTASYNLVVTPNDFKAIAAIMSDHLREQVPILKDFTRFFGRLAQDYLVNAKPSKAAFDWQTFLKSEIRGSEKKGYVLPDRISEIFGLKAGEPVSEKVLKRLSFWNPQSTLHDMLRGVPDPEYRRLGGKYLSIDIFKPKLDLKNASFGSKETVFQVEIGKANKLPKSWTNVPWVNFDGKIIEQNFTQSFEERVFYTDAYGNRVVNILQIPQKTETSWQDAMMNKSGKINDIADATKARTAFAVNGNHSNDAVIVKKFHLWGKENNVATSTIHDAFFANAADMLKARNALRRIYAQTLSRNVIKSTLDEMLARGLPRELYDKYLNEAIEIGLIPVPGKSRIGGRLVTEADILKEQDILAPVPSGFKDDYGWYGVG